MEEMQTEGIKEVNSAVEARDESSELMRQEDTDKVSEENMDFEAKNDA